MRRFLFLAVLAASLLPLTGPAQAQATADQLNKLSLEALTAPPAGGGGGTVRRSYRPAYHARYRPRYHASYRRPYRGRRYARVSYGHASRFHYVPPHRSMHAAHVAYRGRPVVHRSVRVRPAVYHRLRHR
jgi:hypothetical protein